MSAQLDIETASPTSPRSPTSLIGHAADDNSEDTNRGLISGHLRTGLGFTKKALGLGITLLLVGAVVLLALNYSATTEISEGNVLSSSKDHKPLKTASLHYIVNRLDSYAQSHDLKELFGTLEDVTVTSPSGTMDKVKATESHLSADGNTLTLTGAGGSKAVIEKLSTGNVVVSIEKAKTAKTTKPGARRAGKKKRKIASKPTRIIGVYESIIEKVAKRLGMKIQDVDARIAMNRFVIKLVDALGNRGKDSAGGTTMLVDNLKPAVKQIFGTGKLAKLVKTAGRSWNERGAVCAFSGADGTVKRALTLRNGGNGVGGATIKYTLFALDKFVERLFLAVQGKFPPVRYGNKIKLHKLQYVVAGDTDFSGVATACGETFVKAEGDMYPRFV